VEVATPRDLGVIHARLMECFGSPRWRPEAEPLEELIQTILSQHTAHANSRRAFDQLRQRFAAWQDLAEAGVEDIAAAIRPAGLAGQKAPRIRELARRIATQRPDMDLRFLDALPLGEAQAWLEALPGVGPTTAACVLLFGLGRPAMPVDTGIHRVAVRLGLVAPNAAARQVQQLLQAAAPPEWIYTLHVNLIRFSRDICIARHPQCAACPLNDRCAYFQRFQSVAARSLRSMPGP
jgi:endonuclease-3